MSNHGKEELERITIKKAYKLLTDKSPF